jgi:hypothetical protein
MESEVQFTFSCLCLKPHTYACDPSVGDREDFRKDAVAFCTLTLASQGFISFRTNKVAPLHSSQLKLTSQGSKAKATLQRSVSI